MIKKLLTLSLGLLLIFSWSVVPTYARRAIAVTEKLVADSSSNLTSYDTTSGTWDYNGVGDGAGNFQLSAGAVGIAAVCTSDAETPSTVTMGQTNETWTEIGSSLLFNTAAAGLKRITVFKATGSGSAVAGGVFDASAGTGNQTGIVARVYQITGVSTGAVLQTKTQALDGATAHTLTLTSDRTSGSILFHFTCINGNESWTHEYTNTGTEANYATPNHDSVAQWNIDSADKTPLSTSGGAQDGGQFAVEIAVAAPAGGTPKPGAGIIIMRP